MPSMKTLIVTFLLTCAVTSQAADLKFGVVDMAKAFSEFHKTKTASESFKGNVDKATQEVNERWAVYKNLLGEIQKLQKVTQDPILTAGEGQGSSGFGAGDRRVSKSPARSVETGRCADP